jgi:hypothetical protein
MITNGTKEEIVRVTEGNMVNKVRIVGPHPNKADVFFVEDPDGVRLRMVHASQILKG